MTATDITKGRVVLVPGYVLSAVDGDRRYIGAHALAKLYGVEFSKCVVWDISKPRYPFSRRHADVLLYPQESGDYLLPPAAWALLQ